MSLAHARTPVARPVAGQPAGWALAALSGGLACYNVALNHVPFPPRAYVPANVTLAGAVTVLAARRWGLDARALGLTRDAVRPGLALGAAVAGAAGLALRAARALPAAAPLLSDRRASGLAGAALAHAVLVRIPFGTAVTEELLFRGVLLAAHRRRGSERRAVLASSLAFGAWHVGPALVLLDVNRLAPGRRGRVAAVAGVVAATTATGPGFCLLRRRGRGLLAPTLAHAALNGLGVLAAARFQSRTQP